MGYSNEQWIENHNALMETDAEYAENCRREWAMEDDYREWQMAQLEKYEDWFADYKLAHDGYEEFDEKVLSSELIDDDIPF